MKKQKFKLKIDSDSDDGENITNEIEVEMNCSASMAIGVMVDFLKRDKDMRRVVSTAVKILNEKENLDVESKLINGITEKSEEESFIVKEDGRKFRKDGSNKVK